MGKVIAIANQKGGSAKRLPQLTFAPASQCLNSKRCWLMLIHRQILLPGLDTIPAIYKTASTNASLMTDPKKSILHTTTPQPQYFTRTYWSGWRRNWNDQHAQSRKDDEAGNWQDQRGIQLCGYWLFAVFGFGYGKCTRGSRLGDHPGTMRIFCTRRAGKTA